MLSTLRVKSIRIMTNNPDKMTDLEEHGVRIVGRIPVVVAPNEHDRAYMQTKQSKLGHLLGLEQDDELLDSPSTDR
jgi:GTP cyclohydrolase II